MTGFKNRERASTPSKVHCQNNTFHKFEVGTLPLNGLINEKLNGVGKPQSETKKNGNWRTGEKDEIESFFTHEIVGRFHVDVCVD